MRFLRESSIIGLNAAVTDPLTGLYNRRYAQSHINWLLEDARSNGGSVTALMVDIDHFKSILVHMIQHQTHEKVFQLFTFMFWNPQMPRIPPYFFYQGNFIMLNFCQHSF